MDPFWKVAVRATGAVGVIGLLFSMLLKALFQQQIIDLFGSDKMFYIVILVICIFGLALLLAIAMGKHRATKGSSVVYRDNSKHQGDNRF
jgi:nitrate reductase gamma subunit